MFIKRLPMVKSPLPQRHRPCAQNKIHTHTHYTHTHTHEVASAEQAFDLIQNLLTVPAGMHRVVDSLTVVVAEITAPSL
jgi:hypothetical protein